MSWNDLHQSLQDLSKDQVIEIIKGLHDLSPQNKAWLRGKLLPVGQDTAYLEECRRKVVKAVYDPARKTPAMPRFRDAKGVIAEYRKSTRDLRGTLDLMLTYVERGHAFTNDFGDIDEPFYDALINMLERFAVELRNSPARREMYAQFQPRLLDMRHTSDIGWGYGDAVQEIVDDLEEALGEGS
jgi:hypothetical protein